MDLTNDIRDYLLSLGACSVGFADISEITPIKGLNTGIVFYINHEAENLNTVVEGPTYAYLEGHRELNRKLDEIAIKGEEYLIERGFNAYGQTTRRIVDTIENNSAELPHKTIATLAGLGWIGKSALFITKEYGPALRLSSILTDAQLECGIPIDSSLCGECMICQEACPGGAISGKAWNSSLSRDDFYNHKKCEETAKKLSKKAFLWEDTMCGICMNICPHAQKFIKKELNK